MRRFLTLSLLFLVVTAACSPAHGSQIGLFRKTDPAPTAFPTRQIPTVAVPTQQVSATATRAHYSLALCVMSGNKVHLRNAPKASANSLGVLKSPDQVYPNRRMSGVWMEVDTALGHGWVNSNYIGSCPNGEPSNLYDRGETYFR